MFISLNKMVHFARRNTCSFPYVVAFLAALDEFGLHELQKYCIVFFVQCVDEDLLVDVQPQTHDQARLLRRARVVGPQLGVVWLSKRPDACAHG